jgi:hypothetical protein
MNNMIRKLISTIFFSALVMAFSVPAFAGTTVAKISQILLYEAGGLVYVYPVGGVQSPPSCQAPNVTFYSFAFSRPRAREYLAALLSAQARNATVVLQGSGACTDHNVSETLGVIVVVTQ